MRFMAARMRAFLVVYLLGALSSVSPWASAGSPAEDVDEPPLALDLDGAIATGESMPRLHSLLVSQRGQLVLERYFNGRQANDLDNVKSVSKSILSALIGIAIDQGYIAALDTTIGEYFRAQPPLQLNPQKATITLEQLLTMTAGLRTTSNGNYGRWVSSDDWVSAVLEQPLESEPGQLMEYSTGNTHLLSAILTKATGRSTLEFARETLAEPLGFELAAWPRDPQGIFFGGNDMQLTPRQMLAFGELFLNKGRVGDEQIVPSVWIDASLQPRSRSPLGEGRYYGYGWWVCTLAGYVAPHAWGHGGQFIVLVPALDLVIVTTSSTSVDTGAHEHANDVYQLIQYVIRSGSRSLYYPADTTALTM
jgi:CubicO group peptidase (beta-lactamase class C family)